MQIIGKPHLVLTEVEAQALAEVLEHGLVLVDTLDAHKLRKAGEDHLIEVKLLNALSRCTGLGLTSSTLKIG